MQVNTPLVCSLHIWSHIFFILYCFLLLYCLLFIIHYYFITYRLTCMSFSFLVRVIRYLRVSILVIIIEWECAMLLILIIVCKVKSRVSSSTCCMLVRRELSPPWATTVIKTDEDNHIDFTTKNSIMSHVTDS